MQKHVLHNFLRGLCVLEKKRRLAEVLTDLCGHEYESFGPILDDRLKEKFLKL